MGLAELRSARYEGWGLGISRWSLVAGRWKRRQYGRRARRSSQRGTRDRGSAAGRLPTEVSCP
jgi:hypothetical protein